MKITDDMRMENGNLPAYAWPGGYPIYYVAADNGVLCPVCANDYKPERDNESRCTARIAISASNPPTQTIKPRNVALVSHVHASIAC
jgi:hypothetical protein